MVSLAQYISDALAGETTERPAKFGERFLVARVPARRRRGFVLADVTVDKVFVRAFGEAVVDAASLHTLVLKFVLAWSNQLCFLDASSEAWRFKVGPISWVYELSGTLRLRGILLKNRLVSIREYWMVKGLTQLSL